MTAAFAAHAVLSGLLGPWIPEIKQRTALDAGGLGIALTVFAVGLLAGTRISGPAVRRAGGRSIVRGGIPLLGLGIALLPLATGLGSLAAVFLVVGLGAGLVDVAMNVEVVAIERRAGRRMMTAIHGTWSVSLFVGAGLAWLGVAVGIPIGVHLPLSAALVVGSSLPLLRWLPVDDRDPREPGEPGGTRLPASWATLLLCSVAGASFLVEGIAMEWSAVFLRESVGAHASAAGLGVVSFSAGMAISRFLGDRVVARWGQPAVIRTGAACALAALGVSLIAHRPAVSIAAFGIVGLGLGPVVPLAFRSAGSLVRADGTGILPLVVTAGYAGSIVGPLLVGFVADHAGLRTAFLVPLVACAVAALAAGAAQDP